MDFPVNRSSKLRILSKPEDNLRAVMARTPDAEQYASRVIKRTEPFWSWTYRERRRLATACVVVLTIWLFLHVAFGANGMVIYQQKHSELQELQKQLGDIKTQNDRYVDQIKALKTDPATIEREAREQLHYTRPGEVVYVAPSNPVSEKQPIINSARNDKSK